MNEEEAHSRDIAIELFGDSDEPDGLNEPNSQFEQINEAQGDSHPEPGTQKQPEPETSCDSLPNDLPNEKESPEGSLSLSKLPSFKANHTPKSEKNAGRKASHRLPRKKTVPEASSGSDNELTPAEGKKMEAEREIDEVLSRFKSSAKRKNNFSTEFIMEEFAMDLSNQMRKAAEDDIRLNQEQKPAIEKLRVLPFIKNGLTKVGLSQSGLEVELLSCVKLWLEPLPNGALPILDIQIALLEILRSVHVTTEDLRESLVGRVVKFYEVSDRPIHHVRKIAQQLIDKWTRLVIKNSSYDSESRDNRVNDRHSYSLHGERKNISFGESAASQRATHAYLLYNQKRKDSYCRLRRKIRLMESGKKNTSK